VRALLYSCPALPLSFDVFFFGRCAKFYSVATAVRILEALGMPATGMDIIRLRERVRQSILRMGTVLGGNTYILVAGNMSFLCG